ncbi:MAG: tRNA-i(6)A37 thiotransferase enzyme MiaB, partial [Proteobacteria bacterium]|nr:tRNA-i(6)A37 thiotransferase enzyme MiaB [Pseudomonadota bacterium]
VSLEHKRERLAHLQARIAAMAADISRNMVNTVQRVLVEGVSRKDYNQMSGRTETTASSTLPAILGWWDGSLMS